MRLFGRKWAAQVGTLEVSDLDMAFRVVKTSKPEPNSCELSIFNLSERSRALLEELEPATESVDGIPVKIEAGYEEATSVIWLGDLRTVESSSDGPEWITTVGSGDGEAAIKTSRINESFGKATTGETVLRALARALGVGLGNLDLILPRIAASPLAGTLASQGLVLSGSAADQLTAITDALGLEWSIQDSTLQFLERGKPLVGQAVLLNSGTGLIEPAPSVDNEGLLTVRMLMIPGVNPGSLLVLDSKRIKGNYRIVTAVYEGDTSGEPWSITAEAERY